MRQASRKLWDFLELSRPKPFLHKLLLGALLVSIACAFVLNSYFPDEYRSLNRGEVHTAIVQSIIPSLQVVAVGVACATVDHPFIHSLATAIYLWLFLIWDLFIIVGKEVPGARKFRARVRSYLTRIDLPAALAFLILLLIAGKLGEVGAEHFLAGVLCAQALGAAICVAGVALVEPEEQGDEEDPPQEVVATATAEPAVAPPRGASPLGLLAALVLLAIFGGARRH